VEKLNSKNGYAQPEVSVNSPETVESVQKKKRKAIRWEGFAEKDCFKPEIRRGARFL